MKYWEIIVNKIIKAGFSVGWVSALDDYGRTVWIVDAHCDGKRFVVPAEEKLTAFLELEAVIRESSSFMHPCTVNRHSAGTEPYD
jgi:hypothetical protein